MDKFEIDRCGYIVRPFLGYLQIINKETGKRKNVIFVRPETRRHKTIRKDDRDHIFDAYDAQYWVSGVLKYWDNANFLALCQHFTGGRNYYDRAVSK